jgi:hypothetical protein
MTSSPRCKKNPQRERKKKLLIKKKKIFTYYYYYYFFNVCNQYLPELQYKAKSKCEVEFVFFLHVIVQYVCCILLLCWYTCNQSYIEQFFNLHISTLHPSAINSKSFKNQVNMKYMQSVFPLLPFHIMQMSRYN